MDTLPEFFLAYDVYLLIENINTITTTSNFLP